jgi:hypothetical protein
VQFRLAHGNTSEHQLVMARVYSCSVTCVLLY